VATVAPIRGRAADETSQARLESAPGHYKRSKILAEREALRLAREEGAPVVVVNPSAPVGPRDVKPTPTGQMILDFLHGRMPAYVDTGLNVVDVEDVGRGHVLAARHGQVGHRYILGGEDMSLRDILLALAGITGLPAPRVRLPHWAASVAAHASETVARLSGSAPRVTVESTRLARHHMYFDSTRARQELAYESRPALVALERAVRWFHDAGRAPPRRSSVTKASGPGT
jgi:dihydroflavonol-4-reductase